MIPWRCLHFFFFFFFSLKPFSRIIEKQSFTKRSFYSYFKLYLQQKVSFFPLYQYEYCKKALERLTVEMKHELGRDFGIRANCVRFKPYMGSKTGNATLKNWRRCKKGANGISPLEMHVPKIWLMKSYIYSEKTLELQAEIHVMGN